MKPILPIAQGRLRPARSDDLDDLICLLHAPGVRRYLCDDVELPRETVADMLAHSDELEPRGLGLWIIEGRDADFLGIAGLQPVAADAPAAMSGGVEVIVAVTPDHWGLGLAHAGIQALIIHARDTVGLSRLVAAVDQPNARSHQLMQRCGFDETGTSPGPAQDLITYELVLLPITEREA